MKLIYIINKVILILTLLLYLTLFLGLYAQIVLGVTQVLSSLILIFYWKRMANKQKHRLYGYWVLIGIYGLIAIPFWDYFENNTLRLVLTIILIPMGIAIYFFSILNQLKQHNYGRQ